MYLFPKTKTKLQEIITNNKNKFIQFGYDYLFLSNSDSHKRVINTTTGFAGFTTDMTDFVVSIQVLLSEKPENTYKGVSFGFSIMFDISNNNTPVLMATKSGFRKKFTDAFNLDKTVENELLQIAVNEAIETDELSFLNYSTENLVSLVKHGFLDMTKIDYDNILEYYAIHSRIELLPEEIQKTFLF